MPDNIPRCKDCFPKGHGIKSSMVPSAAPRPLVPDSGGRCATHWREEKKRRKEAAHETYVQRTYGLGPGDYGRLRDLQSGLCAICKRATGATRKLSVDHDHATGKVRGLLCRPCNDLLGHARDSAEFFGRAAEYLRNPPANALAREAIQAHWDTQ